MNSSDSTSITRREMMKRTSLAAGAALLSGAVLKAQPTSAQEANANENLMTATEPAAGTEAGGMAASASDVEILNFALGLEYLLHDLYLRVAAANKPGEEQRLYIRGRLGELVPVLRDNKAAHITTLTAMIGTAGGAVVPRGAFNFPADVFLSPISFAQFAATMEEIAAGAYLETFSQLQSNDAQMTGVSLYGNATRHASLIRLLGGYEFAPRYFENAYSIAQTRQLIAPYIA